MSAKKKTTARKKTAPKKLTKAQQAELERKKALSSEIKGTVMVFVGLFVLYCIFREGAGAVGGFISALALRLFGTAGRYIFAAVLAAAGILCIFRKNSFAAFLAVLGVNALAASGFPTTVFDVYAFNEAGLYRDMWNIPSPGGFIGSILAKVLKDLFSYTGAWLFIICVSIVAFIVILRRSFVATVKEEADREREYVESRRREKLTQMLAEEDKKNYIDLSKTKTLIEGGDGSRLVLVEPTRLKDKRGRKIQRIDEDSRRIVSFGKLDGADDSEDIGTEAGTAGGALSGENSRITDRIYRLREAGAAKTGPAAEEKLTEASPAEKIKTEPSSAVPDKSPAAEAAAPFTSPGKDTYTFPPYSLLDAPAGRSGAADKKSAFAAAAQLEKTLGDFGVEAHVSNVSIGPVITRFELQLQPGTRVSKVASLQDDIALALAAKSVRMEAPIPGKSAVGIEIPNKSVSTVKLSEVIRATEFVQHKSPVAAVLGLTLTGEPLVMDISSMPHLLIAGATGSGKSVCINTIITSVLYHASPADVRMILIDPKMVELNVYNEIPHLLIPVVTDPKHAAAALGWAVREMTKRYETFAENKVRDIDGYNRKILLTGEEKMPRVLLIIDELSDLMMVAKQQVEASICRLAQLARAAGIHIVLATQRPSVDVITGLIKANIPSRISFAVSSQIDSRTIIDTAGAEKLLGRGDMLYYPQSFDKPLRAQGAFISDGEIEKVVEFVKKKQTAEYDDGVMNEIQSSAEDSGNAAGAAAGDSGDAVGDDALIIKAMEMAFVKGQISTSALQRRLKLGYARAGRIVDEMEQRGYISEADGAKPRRVLVGQEEFYNMIGGKK